MKMFQTFKLSYNVDLLTLFCLATVWATFSINWATFFPNFQSPCFCLSSFTLILKSSALTPLLSPPASLANCFIAGLISEIMPPFKKDFCPIFECLLFPRNGSDQNQKKIIVFISWGLYHKTFYNHNGTAHIKKCKQLFEYQHFLLPTNKWSKF